MEDIKKWSKNIPLNDSFEIKEMRVIHLYDIPLSAGNGMEIFDETVEYKDYSTSEPRCDFALRIFRFSRGNEIIKNPAYPSVL